MAIYPMLKSLIIGLIGAIIFVEIGLPMPWMLGPLFAVLLVQLFTPISLRWHPVFRNWPSHCRLCDRVCLYD